MTGYPVIVVVMIVLNETQALPTGVVESVEMRYLRPVFIFEGPN